MADQDHRSIASFPGSIDGRAAQCVADALILVGWRDGQRSQNRRLQLLAGIRLIGEGGDHDVPDHDAAFGRNQ